MVALQELVTGEAHAFSCHHLTEWLTELGLHIIYLPAQT